MTDEQCYLAGEIVPLRDARIPANDAGLLLGVGLFETLRTYGGRPFLLERHLARMRESGELFRVYLKESDQEIAEAIAALVEANNVPDARVRLTATRGPMTEPLSDEEAPPATLLVMAGPMTPYPEALYAAGATVVVSDLHTNETDPVTFHKTTGYLANLLALRDARRARAVEALRFNTKNRLGEGAVSNVFLVSEGRLLTPPVEDGLLAGITRGLVLELASEEKIDAEQTSLTVYDLTGADEVFLTNSIMEILPVTRVEARTIGNGEPGPVTQRLMAAYRGKAST